jgi:glycosyltransferase involved in cell wall biosynthesis
MTAFNYERYILGALKSVLTQDYPPEKLDVVVVDDGSTDGTAAVVHEIAGDAGGRVRLVQQQNAGLAAATTTALKHASGEFIAICDADDQWLPGKVRSQVDVLLDRPEVSLVYGDMQVIDEFGRVLAPSFFASQNVMPRRGRVLEELLSVNFTTNSTLMLRATHATPIPACSPYADYWLVTHAAAAGEVEVIERPLSSYRLHSSNMNFGAQGARRVRECKRELAIRRLILASDVSDALSVDGLVRAVRRLANKSWELSAFVQTPLAEMVTVTDTERARAQRELTSAADDLDSRVRGYAVASLLDFHNAGLRAAMERLAEEWRLQREARTQLTVTWSHELLAAPDLIAAYCQSVEGSEEPTRLMIFTDGHDLAAVAAELRRCCVAVGVDPDRCPDMVLAPSSAWCEDYAAAARLTTACPTRPS